MLISTAMKKITLFLFLSMVIVFSAEAHRYRNRNANITISIQTFYDQLSPYGDWINSPDYGYVWRPYFDNPESFRPYSSNGNWVYTDYGWTWSSGYDWGWATFHYGRWDFDNYLGWLWIPGYDWAPAWVNWGSYDNYWGWAPMGPTVYVQSNWYAPDPWWTFVSQDHFCSSNWDRYIYERPVHHNNITHITNVYVGDNRNNQNSWYNGPKVADVERYSTTKVRRMEVGESERPEKSGIHNNRLDVYRPTVENKRNDYRPAEYRNVEQVRTGRKIERTTARTNDPGENRIRENQTVGRTITPKPVQRENNSSRETRVDSHTSTQTPNTATTEDTRYSREVPRATTQPEPRNNSANRETRNDPRNSSQAAPERNTNRPSTEAQKENPDRRSNINVTEGNRAIGNTNRVENTDNRQTRNSVPVRENVNTNNASRESQQRQTPVIQPTREQRTQNATSTSNTRNENTERKQSTKEEVKPVVSESRKSIENSENRSSGIPNRR